MNTISKFLHCSGCTPRTIFLRNTGLLAAGKTIIDLQVMQLRPDLFTTWSWSLAWVDPFVMVRPWLDGQVPFLACCTTFAFFAGLVWNSVHRARHAGWDHRLGLLAAVPWMNIVAVAALSIVPVRKRPSVFDLP